MFYVNHLRQSDNLVFDLGSETFTFAARSLTDAKRRATRKQFHEESNLRLEDENGDIISIKRSGFKWEDTLKSRRGQPLKGEK
ncbi:MAG: hypothetical protein EHM37_19085 [Deltaproteobacteria bacterium]|nr:MAG: hypothetical protein EHM37_19085 [Deltaproteobacteria bacterium]